MKKVLISIGLITNLLNQNNAQIQKGSWLLDGGLHYNQKTSYGNAFGVRSRIDESTVYLNGTVGYFLSDKLAVGASAGIDAITRHTIERGSFALAAYDDSEQKYHISPFVRYYFNPKSKFKTFYDLSVGGNWGRTVWTNFNYGVNPDITDRFYLNVKNTLGANYFLTPNLALEASIDYNHFYHINDPRFEGRPALSPQFPKAAFTPKFGIKVFLNTEKQDATILAAKYLRKGNMTIGLSAAADIGNFNLGVLNPSIGYFLTDKWMLMGSLSVRHNAKHYSSASISPELQYYQPVSPTTQVFFRGAVNLGASKNNFSQTIKPQHSLEMGIGLNRFVAENVSVQGSVNLNAAPGNLKTEISPNIKVGFQYFLNR